MTFTRNFVINSHRADEDQALEAGLLHRSHNAPGLLFQLTGEIRIHDILACHGRLQRFRVQNIAFHHAHAVGMAGFFETPCIA